MIRKKILFITTSNLATNPRLVKEIELASEYNFKISVIYFKINGWSNHLNEDLVSKYKNIEFIEISAIRNPFFPWFVSSILEFVLRKIPSTILPLKLLAYSINKRSILLNYNLNKIQKSFDWVIAHNLGAFYPAYAFARKNGSKLGIDVEDYHPGESLNEMLNQRMILLMKKILPEAYYCSFAAPLIEKEIRINITNKIKSSIVVLNGFNESDFEFKESVEGKLKLVWYSQNIDFGRGLELIIPILIHFEESIQLTLIGSLNSQFYRELELSKIKNIQILSPLKQKDLHKLLSEFDVGLALEKGKDRNNMIALSNKIISYVQAGLYVLSFLTPAQEEFISTYGIHGKVIHTDNQTINKCFLELLQLKNRREIKKQNQFEIGRKLAWQNISKPLIKQWLK